MKKSFIFLLFAVSILILLFLFTVQAQLSSKKVLTLDVAKKLAAVAEAEALKNKWTMVIALVDDGGNLVLLEKIDNTQIGSIEVAIQKAKTSISFKRPTKAFEEKVLDGRSVILGISNVMPIEGGLPLIVDGQYIGAIGVSGGSSDQDGIVAKAAFDALSAQKY